MSMLILHLGDLHPQTLTHIDNSVNTSLNSPLRLHVIATILRQYPFSRELPGQHLPSAFCMANRRSESENTPHQ